MKSSSLQACPTYEDIDLIAPILNNYTASLKPIPEPFKSPVGTLHPFLVVSVLLIVHPGEECVSAPSID